MSNIWRKDAFDMDFGSELDIWFSPMPKLCNLGRVINMLSGSHVWLSWLSAADMNVSDDILYNEEGSIPENLFSTIAKALKLVNFSISSDMLPSKLLYATDRISREERFQMEAGIFPVKLFVNKLNFSRLLREPSSVGILLWTLGHNDAGGSERDFSVIIPLRNN